MRTVCHILAILFCCSTGLAVKAQNGWKRQNLSSFVEYGVSAHTGENTPLWK